MSTFLCFLSALTAVFFFLVFTARQIFVRFWVSQWWVCSMALDLTSCLCRMPLAISRIGRLDLIDEQLFYLAARDFYSQLEYSESHRQAFANTFQSVAAPDTPYANVFTFCGGSARWSESRMPAPAWCRMESDVLRRFAVQFFSASVQWLNESCGGFLEHRSDVACVERQHVMAKTRPP